MNGGNKLSLEHWRRARFVVLTAHLQDLVYSRGDGGAKGIRRRKNLIELLAYAELLLLYIVFCL